eukprot:TRINITY_DN6983_c0_g1_i4.p1 TRINITY_DN6983_c0_g1~~TRINITY_DN6983_c0_g1_i4.p1  ORF type:complete len:117 (+),score=41.58 TRINITY_DN6983_c0_g1_i4:3-353(+)
MQLGEAVQAQGRELERCEARVCELEGSLFEEVAGHSETQAELLGAEQECESLAGQHRASQQELAEIKSFVQAQQVTAQQDADDDDILFCVGAQQPSTEGTALELSLIHISEPTRPY